MKNNLIKSILTFLKIGAIGFGGGSALIPVVEKEIVENNKWLTEKEFTKNTIIASITPGALPVKLGALSKYSIPSAFSVAFAGSIMVVIILTLFSLIGESAVKYIEFASVGISSFIILLLVNYIIKVQKSGIEQNLKKPYVLIMLISFLLTAGKEIRQIILLIIKFENKPIFDIATIDLMIISFFIIIFYGNSNSKFKLLIGILLSFVYALSKGKIGLFSEFTNSLLLLMIFFAIASVLKDSKVNISKISIKNINNVNFKNIVYFVLISVVISAFAILLNSQVHGYIFNIVLSTATSFGGGEAYVSVADSFFVQSGYVEPQVFYNQMVAVANALPGPILVKIASAVGYFYGVKIKGMFFGWFLSLVGFILSVSTSSVCALFIKLGFEKLENSIRLKLIIKYILPVVCGMLITTSFSILFESLSIMVNKCTLSPYLGIIFICALILIMNFCRKKFKVCDLILLLSAGSFTLLLFNFFNN